MYHWFPLAALLVKVTDPPSQKVVAVSAEIVGVVGVGFTVMVIVALEEAHSPTAGVKVYVVVVVLFIVAGDQVPVIPLLEVVGKADKVAPEQMAATWVKVGATRVPQSQAPTSSLSDPKAIGV